MGESIIVRRWCARHEKMGVAKSHPEVTLYRFIDRIDRINILETVKGD